MDLGSDYFISPLDDSHCVKKLRLRGEENQPLGVFLKRDARDFQRAKVGRTYVACLPPSEGDEQPRVIGFITLTCSEVDINNAYELADCASANRYKSLPAIKIARLATDYRYAGRGIGMQLISLAVALAADSVSESVGCRFLVTDAKQGAITFYENQGFTLLDSEENKNRTAPVMFLDLNTLAESQVPDDEAVGAAQAESVLAQLSA